MDIESRVNKLINEGYEFKLEKYISIGFELFKKEYGLFIGFSIVAGLISMAINMIPIIGPIVQIVLATVINLGYFVVARKIKNGEQVRFEDFFTPFNSFGNLIGISLVISILTVIGLLCLFIPGLYLAIAWSFAVPIIFFYPGIGMWDSMEASRRVINKNWWNFLLLVICVIFINIAGALCLLIGLLITIPASHLIMYAAFDDVMKPDEITNSDDDDILLNELTE